MSSDQPFAPPDENQVKCAHKTNNTSTTKLARKQKIIPPVFRKRVHKNVASIYTNAQTLSTVTYAVQNVRTTPAFF